MSPEAWTFFGVLTTTSAATLLGLGELVRGNRRRDRAAAAGDDDQGDDEAPEDDRTTAGFRRSVLASLAELKGGQVDLRRRLDRHLGDHASSDLRRPHRERPAD